MRNADFKEYTLFCPVCNAHFKQLVVMHKLPKNFKIDSYLSGMVERHDHKAYQQATLALKTESDDGRLGNDE
jgi:hypothetical protein